MKTGSHQIDYTCRGCGRPEEECSVNPCAGVIADREATV